MKEFELERRVVDGMSKSLPAGWEVHEAPVDSGFDVVATSPTGNVFPIEIRGGTGDLDVTSVVQFGSTVRMSAGSGKLDDFLAKYRKVVGPVDVNVKPILVTSRDLPPATNDYAKRLNIDIVTPHQRKSVTFSQSDVGPLKDQVVDQLKSWDKRIQDTGKSAQWFTTRRPLQ